MNCLLFQLRLVSTSWRHTDISHRSISGSIRQSPCLAYEVSLLCAADVVTVSPCTFQIAFKSAPLAPRHVTVVGCNVGLPTPVHLYLVMTCTPAPVSTIQCARNSQHRASNTAWPLRSRASLSPSSKAFENTADGPVPVRNSHMSALAKLPWGLGRFLLCAVGKHFSRLRHLGWE